MRVLSVRDLAGLRPVLLDPAATGIDPVYQVYTDLGDPRWQNRTEIYSGRIGKEFPKTFGHYHAVADPETYRVVSGTGILVLQKKHSENGIVVAESVEEVLLIRAAAGDELVITPEWGHGWSNINQETLVLLDDWKTGHTAADYQIEEKLHGMAYYLVDEGGPKEMANPNYKNPPPVKWLTAMEFKASHQTENK